MNFKGSHVHAPAGRCPHGPEGESLWAALSNNSQSLKLGADCPWTVTLTLQRQLGCWLWLHQDEWPLLPCRADGLPVFSLEFPHTQAVLTRNLYPCFLVCSCFVTMLPLKALALRSSRCTMGTEPCHEAMHTHDGLDCKATPGFYVCAGDPSSGLYY